MIKTKITFLLFVFVLASCQEQEKTTDKKMVAEETEPSAIDTPETTIIKDTVITLNNEPSLTLPTPDASFFVGLDSSDVEAILEKYLNYYKIENDYIDNLDGSEQFQLKNYNLKEVKRVLRTLLPKKSKNGDEDGWYYDAYENRSYYLYQGMCNLEIDERKNTIIIDYGCSC